MWTKKLVTFSLVFIPVDPEKLEYCASPVHNSLVLVYWFAQMSCWNALHFMVWQLHVAIQNMVVFCTAVAAAEMHDPSLTGLISTVWSLKHSANINECQWVPFFFSVWRNSIPHMCFVYISISDTILPDCPSAATCHTAAKCSIGGRVQTLLPYCPNLPLILWANIKKKIGGITFRAVLVLPNKWHTMQLLAAHWPMPS